MNAVVEMNREAGIPGVGGRFGVPPLDARIPATVSDPSGELLRTIAEVLDIREVFPRVSQIVTHMVPHDCLELVVHDHTDQVMLHARSASDLPDYQPVALADREEFCLVPDLREGDHAVQGREREGVARMA